MRDVLAEDCPRSMPEMFWTLDCALFIWVVVRVAREAINSTDPTVKSAFFATNCEKSVSLLRPQSLFLDHGLLPMVQVLYCH